MEADDIRTMTASTVSSRQARLNPKAIRRVFPVHTLKHRFACLTLDLEKDHDGFTDQFDTINRLDRIHALLELLRSHHIPLTIFVVTELLRSHPHIIKLFDACRPEWASHSHHHRLDVGPHQEAIRQSRVAFTEFFKCQPKGFRGPFGYLHPRDVDVLRVEGFIYDASIFPALWTLGSGFQHRRLPTLPWEYENGLLELPCAVVPRVRVMLSVSYLKLLGLRVVSRLLQLFPPEPVLVIVCHLHDLIPTPARRELPLALRLARKRNETSGFMVLNWLIDELRSRGYVFVTMAELAQNLLEISLESSPPHRISGTTPS